MKNSTLSGDDVTIYDVITTATWEDENNASSNFLYTRDLALKVIYVITGTVGVLGNIFVIVIFVCFVKIADKVSKLAV